MHEIVIDKNLKEEERPSLAIIQGLTVPSTGANS